jgi:hypothetical protein
MQFDLIKYMANMTGYSFTREQLEHIALNRGTLGIEHFHDLTLRDKNLMLADMLFIIYTSPTSSGAITKQHGDYSVTIGSAQIGDKDKLYKLIDALYKNPDKELNQLLADSQGGLSWLTEYD